jgi:hypothetical protein
MNSPINTALATTFVQAGVVWRAQTYLDGEPTKLVANAHGVWWTLESAHGRVRCWFDSYTSSGSPMMVPVFRRDGSHRDHFDEVFAMVGGFSRERVARFADVEDARIGADLERVRGGG